MAEERKEKVEDFRVRWNNLRGRVAQMNEREQSVKPLDAFQSLKPLDELRLNADKLDKDLSDKLRACFTHEV